MGETKDSTATRTANWPEPLAEEAFHGLAGEIVHTIEPHTESDPAALLVQLLVAFGNVIHRGPHWRAEADRHALNLFAVVVGETSKARKGTSWTHIRRLVSHTEAVWTYLIQTGLSSGEGLIHAVRDTAPAVCSGNGTAEQGESTDSGPPDTRLLVVESEFASPLRMISRDGNTLSPVVRQAWDGGTLQVMTKQFPEKATRAHVSIIGHVTRDELRREMTRIDAANGFGNRFLWICARRSKALPDGGCLPEADFKRLADRLKHAVEHAVALEDFELRRNDEASATWRSIYARLSEGKPGLFGAVTSRAEAQVMRLACIYALLDEQREVRPEHLRAALAVWDYCAASAAYIFGDALGDPLADHIHQVLRRNREGLTRTEINNALRRNYPESAISRALSLLEEYGLATVNMQGTAGRPAERWQATSFVKFV